MKTRNYEKNKLIILSIILCFTVELIFILFLYTKKIQSFYKINSIVIKDNTALVVASKEERKIIYQNKNLFLHNNKINYKVIEDRGKTIKKGDTSYYEIILEFKFDNKYKANDVIEVSLKKENKRIIKIFKLIWDGD